MDTIIYFYHSRESEDFITEKWQEDDYCLIRAGVPPFVWQNCRKIKEEPPQMTDDRASEETAQSGLFWWWKHLLRKRKPSGHDNAKKTKEEMPSSCIPADLPGRVEEWHTALRLLCENRNRTYCIYEEFLRDKLATETGKRLWQHWDIMEFSDYREKKWVEKLMKHAAHGSYVIIGYSPCLPQLLYEHARKIRSIRWILEQEQYTRDIQDFLEDFYEETGLAVETQFPEEGQPMVRVRPASAVPVNVLDFSGEEKLSAGEMPEGSIWLDMDSLEGKNRRMEARNQKVLYVSLKKDWNQYQKAAIRLDTIGKSRYNT